MAEIAVVGAGISGLASAWFLRSLGHRVRVLEASPAVGGCIRTMLLGGFRIEAGPNSTLVKGGAFAELVRGVELDSAMIEANRIARRRYVVKAGVPTPLPGSLAGFVATPLFSAPAKLRLLGEPFRARASGEETVAQFVRRRLGPEFLDWAIDPFVSGVYAGDPERLSVRAATAKVHALEAEHGSLLVGAVARMLRGRASAPQPTGKLVSFHEGMATLPLAIAGALGADLALASPVTAIAPQAGRLNVETVGEVLRVDQVVLAIGAVEAANLLDPLAPNAASELRAIAYPPVLSVALGFQRADVTHPLDGFGMLIPKREHRRTLGVLFSSTLFPGRAPDGKVLLTAFIGGARDPSIAGLDDRAVIAQVLADISPLLGIHSDPVLAHISRWARAIPQYELGHLERLRRIDAALAATPGLHTRSNWRDGISVADCVANARALAQRIGAAAPDAAAPGATLPAGA
jgi:oxygen-dependent protoporphyrinogen oxidase